MANIFRTAESAVRDGLRLAVMLSKSPEGVPVVKVPRIAIGMVMGWGLIRLPFGEEIYLSNEAVSLNSLNATPRVQILLQKGPAPLGCLAEILGLTQEEVSDTLAVLISLGAVIKDEIDWYHSVDLGDEFEHALSATKEAGNDCE